MALITKALVKGTTYLPQIAASSTSDDTAIDACITRVGRIFAKWCGYAPASVGGNASMETTTYTAFRLTVPRSHLVPDGASYDQGAGGLARLRLPFGPITSVVSVYNDPELAFGSDTLLSASDYEVDAEIPSVIRLLPRGNWGTWQPGDGALKISCVAGFATVPDDLEHAAGMMVRHLFELGSVQGKSNVSVGGGSEGRRDETIPDAVKEILGPFRLPYLLCGGA